MQGNVDLCELDELKSMFGGNNSVIKSKHCPPWVFISSHGDFSLERSFYTGSFISSHCFKNILNMKIYAFRIFILSQKLHFSHHINLFFHFGFHFSSFRRFVVQYNKFCEIWTICLLRNLSETLPAFI